MEQEIPSSAEAEIRQRNAKRAKLDRILADTNAVVFEDDGITYVDCENTGLEGMTPEQWRWWFGTLASSGCWRRRRNMFRKPFPEMNFSRAGVRCAENMAHQVQNRIKRGDIYTLIASGLFGVPEENITPAMRKAAKEKVYWILYS